MVINFTVMSLDHLTSSILFRKSTLNHQQLPRHAIWTTYAFTALWFIFPHSLSTSMDHLTSSIFFSKSILNHQQLPGPQKPLLLFGPSFLNHSISMDHLISSILFSKSILTHQQLPGPQNPLLLFDLSFLNYSQLSWTTYLFSTLRQTFPQPLTSCTTVTG